MTSFNGLIQSSHYKKKFKHLNNEIVIFYFYFCLCYGIFLYLTIWFINWNN